MVARRRLWDATRCCSKCVATGLCTKPCSASKGGRPRKFTGGAKPTAVTFLGPTPRPPQHGEHPDTAHRSSWRARPSKGSVSTLFSLCLGFRPSSFASMCCTRWTWARRRTRLEIYFSIWSQAGLGHNLFSFSCMCVCACVLVCVGSSVLCVHVQLCFVPLAGPGLFCAQSRCGRIAELWNRIKLHYKTFHTQSRLQKLTWEMIRVDQKPPKLRAKGAETRHLVPCCFELARTSTSTRGQLTASLSVDSSSSCSACT